MVVFRPIRQSFVKDVHRILRIHELQNHGPSTQLELQSREHMARFEMETHFKQLRTEWEKQHQNKVARSKQASVMEINEDNIFAY